MQLEKKGNSDAELEHAKIVLEKSTLNREKIVERASRMNKNDFDKYAPFLENLNLEKQSAYFSDTLIIVRRLTMLYMAMFVLNRQWIQLQLFIALNFLSVTYVVTVRPFESRLLNFLNLINEMIGLLASYMILPLQNMEYDPEVHYEMAYYTIYIFYASGAINLTVILYVSALETIALIKKLYRNCCKKKTKKDEKYEEKTSKQDDPSEK